LQIKLVKDAEDCEVVAAAAARRKVAMTELESLCAALEEQRKRSYPRCCALFVVGSLSASSDAGDCADAPSDGGPAGRIRWKINFWWSEKGPILTSAVVILTSRWVFFLIFKRGAGGGGLFGLTGHFGKIKNTHTKHNKIIIIIIIKKYKSPFI